MLIPWKKSYDQPRQHIKKQRRYFASKGPSSQSHGFSSNHVWMWELDYKESWAPKNWCFWTVVLEKTFKSPSDSKEIKSINPKGNQSWIFIGSWSCIFSIHSSWIFMLKLKLQQFGHLMRRTDSVEKTLMLGKIEGRKRRGRQRMRWSDGITNLTDMSWSSSESWWRTGKPGVPQSMASQSGPWLKQNWTELWPTLTPLTACFLSY